MQKKKIKNYFRRTIKNPNYEIKDKNILLTQSVENADAFDMGYLFGPSKEKIFIGFQMKSYKDSNSSSITLSKTKIIEDSKQILITSNYLFNVNIVEFHFIVVGIDIDQNDVKFSDEEKKYSKNLINYCINNSIELILYNPIQKIFLTSEKEKITKLSMINLKFSNLFEEKYKNIFKYPNPQGNIFLGKKRKLTRCHEFEDALTSFIGKDLNIGNIIKEIQELISNISRELLINNLKFVSKELYNDKEAFIPIPNDNFLFVFKLENSSKKNDLNNYCFLIKKPNEDLFLYSYAKKEIIKKSYPIQYFGSFDLQENYFIFSFSMDNPKNKYFNLKMKI